MKLLLTILTLITITGKAQKVKFLTNPSAGTLMVDTKDSLYTTMRGKEATLFTINPYSSEVLLFVKKVVVLAISLYNFNGTYNGKTTLKWTVVIDGKTFNNTMTY